MLTALLLILLGLVLLYFGAEWLVSGAASLALTAGLTPLVVGLTVVAYGTSMPEMVVSVTATLKDQGDIAIGNVVGSNICTIGIVLGISALIRPLDVKLQMLRRHVPLMIAGCVLLTGMLWDGHLGRIEGAILFLGIIVFTIINFKESRNETSQDVLDEFSDGSPKGGGKLIKDIGLVIFGISVLIGGGHLLLTGSVTVAQRLGISEAVIGLTVVAFGTSAPDLVASAVAAYRKHSDIAIGNALGSVMFNTFNVVGFAALVRPLDAPGVSHMDLYIMIGMAVAVLPLMMTGFVIKRWEGGVFVLAYIAYIVYRWPTT